MKAEDVRLLELLEGPKQFIVPVFQRDYSWGTRHCLQLWNDVVRVGSDTNANAHFVGSVVYIAAGDTSAKISRWLLIDGQQRLTTLTILLAALRNRLATKEVGGQQDDDDLLPTRIELEDYYLCNTHAKGNRRYKLHLRREDHEALAALVDHKKPVNDFQGRITENFEFFDERLENCDLSLIYRGIKKLVAVDVSLTRGQDDPQMIFESLNSTGLDLTQADLIRNFVLMRQDEELQTVLYQDYWRPIETAFGWRYRSDFDKFARDYLTLKLEPSKQLRANEIYQQFRTYFYAAVASTRIEEILAELKRFGTYYVAFSLGQEGTPELSEAMQRLRLLVEVVSPVVMRLYDCYDRAKSLNLDDFVTALGLLESYVFRRSVCGMQTRSLGQIFATLAYRVKEDDPLTSLKVALYRQGTKRRFPTDAEFREALETRDVYDMRHCHYLLDRLENASKERIDTSTFTIEHVMPQNDRLRPEWQAMLGPDWETVRGVWLHRLGNITLTGYNSEYSDRPFSEKKSIEGGFKDSPLRLNKFIREQQTWTAKTMERRGKNLAASALAIWSPVIVEMEAVRKADLEERKEQASRYSVDSLPLGQNARALFDQLRPQVLALGEDIAELCAAVSVTYRVHDFFLEVLQRKRRLLLVLNLDYDECEDPSQRAMDATEYAFIPNATEKGGVIFSFDTSGQLEAAMNVIRQAYEKVAE